MRLHTLGLALLLVLAGCVNGTAPDPDDPARCDPPEARFLPASGSTLGARMDAAERYDLLAFFPRALPPILDATAAPPGWSFESTVVAVTDAGSLLRLSLDAQEGPLPSGGPLRVAWHAPGAPPSGCATPPTGFAQWDLPAPAPGDRPQAGQGVHVHAAGVWENGTVFWTNLVDVDQDAHWPKAGWYEWGGGHDLAVYVYDASPQERSDLWAPPPHPVTGQRPWNYATTIAGFNAALKEMTSFTPRVAWLAPEQAYTVPGNQAHHLYGDALVFYILVQEVVHVPCPPETPDRSVCRVAA